MRWSRDTLLKSFAFKRTDACSRPLCYTLKCLAYKKKRQKHEKKISPQKIIFSYLFSLQLFSAVATMFSLFSHKKLKKLPSKVAHNRPKILFFSTGPAAQLAQKQKSFPPKALNVGLGI